MTNNEFSSARNMAEIEAFEEQMKRTVTYDAFEVYMADADRSGLGDLALRALTLADGDYAAARHHLALLQTIEQ